ncbi:hypothetical protein ACTMS3_04505 [Streptococcus suis]|uniref:hypothetical protein n=1 Tax=Streptococcus suis TaxID=1307 RepID=UPI003F8960D4
MNEKLGVLLVDVPDIMFFKYNYIIDTEEAGTSTFIINGTDFLEKLERLAYKCTQEEAKNLSVYKWLDGRPPRQRMLDKIDELYEQTKDVKPKVLAQRGKIRILYPYYSHQRQPWEK